MGCGANAGAVDAVVCEHHAYGGAGAAKLGEAVISACKQQVDFKFLYDLKQSIKVQHLWQPADLLSDSSAVQHHLSNVCLSSLDMFCS